jgi:CheY-like chemotaxis protein
LTVFGRIGIDISWGGELVAALAATRGRVVVFDENDSTRAFVCGALAGAGYDVAPAATTIGLRKALEPDRPALVVCDVSTPLNYKQIVTLVESIRSVTEGHAPIILCGSQSSDQLTMLVRASGAAGFVERREDPMVLIRQIQRLVATPRRTVPPDQIHELGDRRSQPAWAIVKLLLIDDSEITLELMQERLRQGGFDVRIALSLGEVRSIIQGWSPNVIVADVSMPDMRGDDLCARLKAAVETRDAIVMLCSSMPEQSLCGIAEAAGADGFVSKGLGLDHFVSSIEAMCRRISNPLVSFR